MENHKKEFKIIFTLIMGLFFMLPRMSHAAILSISPSSGTYKVGDVFSVTVDVSSYSQSMNAVSGTLSYPKDTLSLVSVSKNDSLLSTWLPPGATGPTYSTSSGTIHFEGVLIGGYTGGPKTVFMATFKVKKTGTAKLSFVNGAILANDGNGTDLTQALKPANYKLAMATTPAVVVGSVKNTKPKVPSATTEKPVETSQFVDVTPPIKTPVVAVSNEIPVQKTFADYYWIILVGGIGILILLTLVLVIRVTQLKNVIRQLAFRKISIPRRKKLGYSSQKISVRSKPSGSNVLRGVSNK